MGNLYVVATPIGNLEDISQRALNTLKSVDLVLSEDTRVGRKILERYGINTPLQSYHQHSTEEKKLFILNLLMNGKNIALITDAGTPGISDPGNELVNYVLRATEQPESSKVIIIPVPGPSAVTAALSVCGFNTNSYLFLGFWPKKKSKKILDLVGGIDMPAVYFDSPHRLIKNLEIIADRLGGERRIFVGRELTKAFETHYRGSIQSVLEQLKNEKNLKGEIVVVVE